jgi:hypothetical protein
MNFSPIPLAWVYSRIGELGSLKIHTRSNHFGVIRAVFGIFLERAAHTGLLEGGFV